MYNTLMNYENKQIGIPEEITRVENQETEESSEIILEEGKISQIPSFENLKNFVQESARLGLHLQIPQDVSQTDQQWANNINVLGIYLFTDDDIRQTNIGEKYVISKQRVHQLVKQTTRKLYEVSPEELQERYPYESFDFRKPNGLKTRIKISKERGGVMHEVIQMAEAGLPPEEIMETLGITITQLSHMRKTLIKNGIIVPYIRPVQQKEFKESINSPDLTTKERQRLLDLYESVSPVSQSQNSELVKITPLIRQAGLNVTGRTGGLQDIAKILKENNIAVKLIEREYRNTIMRYSFAAAVDKDTILDILKNDPALEKYRKNPVSVLGRETERKPSIYELINSDNYIPVKALLGDLFGIIRSRNLYPKLFTDELPFSVFNYHTYYLHVSDFDTAQEYLKNKVAELLRHEDSK